MYSYDDIYFILYHRELYRFMELVDYVLSANPNEPIMYCGVSYDYSTFRLILSQVFLDRMDGKRPKMEPCVWQKEGF